LAHLPPRHDEDDRIQVLVSLVIGHMSRARGCR